MLIKTSGAGAPSAYRDARQIVRPHWRGPLTEQPRFAYETHAMEIRAVFALALMAITAKGPPGRGVVQGSRRGSPLPHTKQ